MTTCSASQDLCMTSGDAPILELTIMERSSGEPVDLTGSSAVFVVGLKNSRRIVLTKNGASGVSVVDAESGRIDVDMQAADTADLAGVYSYELQITDVLGNRTTPLRGDFTIRQDLIET